MSWEVVQGDNREVLKILADNSIDSVVCDPPYGLEFMGKEWDSFGGGAKFTKPGIGDRDTDWPTFTDGGFGGANPTCAVCGGRARGKKKCSCTEPDWRVQGKKLDPADRRRQQLLCMQETLGATFTECMRVLKPGGHLLACGGTRTYHRLVCAIEDAGFEIRDSISWIYATGFPKSRDVCKAIDAEAGAEREVVGQGRGRTGALAQPNGGSVHSDDNYQWPGDFAITAPATDDAKKWEGWGTALKPAVELICLARKPLSEKTVAANVLKWGTGAINIDATRVPIDPEADASQLRTMHRGQRTEDTSGQTWGTNKNGADQPEVVSSKGRWPANCLHDGSPEVVEGFPDRKTTWVSSTHKNNRGGEFLGELGHPGEQGLNDSGSAARFFYCAKSSKGERNKGLPEGMVNSHATVKPIELMKWLCRLVTPPGGTICDPFTGSGTTGCAATMEGFDFLGIELDDHYCNIARARIDYWSKQPLGTKPVKSKKGKKKRETPHDIE
jgi:DNA modification methylase